MGMMFAAQIQSIASSLTRTQPCETGTGGTYESPWIAKPPYEEPRPPQRSERVDVEPVDHLVDVEHAAWRVGDRGDALVDVGVAAARRGVEGMEQLARRRRPSAGRPEDLPRRHSRPSSEAWVRRRPLSAADRLQPDNAVSAEACGLLECPDRLLCRIAEGTVRPFPPSSRATRGTSEASLRRGPMSPRWSPTREVFSQPDRLPGPASRS